MAKLKIRDVLDELTEKQRKALAEKRGVKLNGLANSYGGDWVKLMQDMTKPALARALSQILDDNELRVVALRAFDGKRTTLDRIDWKDDGKAPRKRQAIQIAKAVCGWAPAALQADSWKNEVEPRLRDIGIESLDRPKRRTTGIMLRRIFR